MRGARRPLDSFSVAPDAIVFYDGHCGLCAHSVKFLLPRDRGDRFRFAALDSETFRARIPETARGALPDSLVILEENGRLSVRSAAVIAMLGRLGPGWKFSGFLLRLIPRPLRDFAYDRLAAVRKKWFAPPPPDFCAMVAPELRAKFLP